MNESGYRPSVHAVVLGAGFGWAWLTGQLTPFLGAAVVLFAHWVFAARDRWTPQGPFGAANAVTAVRLLLVFVLAWIPTEHLVPSAGVLMMVFFGLDGLDGWLAQRNRSASAFGAAFDMETDALMTAVAMLAAVQAGLAGPWVLLVGALRYAFVLLTAGSSHGPEPKRRWGRWAFSLMMAGLIGAFLWPMPLTLWTLAAGAGWVVLSFLRGFAWAWFGR